MLIVCLREAKQFARGVQQTLIKSKQNCQWKMLIKKKNYLPDNAFLKNYPVIKKIRIAKWKKKSFFRKQHKNGSDNNKMIFSLFSEKKV